MAKNLEEGHMKRRRKVRLCVCVIGGGFEGVRNVPVFRHAVLGALAITSAAFSGLS